MRPTHKPTDAKKTGTTEQCRTNARAVRAPDSWRGASPGAGSGLYPRSKNRFLMVFGAFHVLFSCATVQLPSPEFHSSKSLTPDCCAEAMFIQSVVVWSQSLGMRVEKQFGTHIT